MISKTFELIGKEDIEALVHEKATESKTLEFKEALPKDEPDAKRKFLAGVSSFANTSGGDIIYGIRERREDGENGKTGYAESIAVLQGESADDAKRRLEECIRNGIAPRVAVSIKEISVVGKDGQGYVILLRIPKSYNAPHMVTFGGSSRFYARNSSGKYMLDVHEIRAAFIQSEDLPRRIRDFRMERLARIIADEGCVPLLERPKAILPGFIF